MGLFSVWSIELSLLHTPTAFLQQVELTEDKLTMLLCKKLFALAVFAGVISLSLELTCPEFRQKPQKTLMRLRRHFLFVEKPFTTPQSPATVNPRRVSRDVTVQTPGTSKCPWSWAQDDNPDRVPRFLSKAVCPDCPHYCRSVLYYHKGLVQRCDVSTGQTVWKWTLVELPVAFVYDP